jgi:hypothetical protein
MHKAVMLLALVLGCVYEPAELGRYETGEEGALEDPSSGVGAIDWDTMDLCEGATLVADLGNIDMEVNTVHAGVHRVVIEVVPIQPPSLPEGFIASIHPLQGEAPLEPSDAGLRYEGDLQLGWSMSLHADEPSIVEVRARIIPESDENAADRTLCEVMPNHNLHDLGALALISIVALSGCDEPIDEPDDVATASQAAGSGCETEYSPYPFMPCRWPQEWSSSDMVDSACDPLICENVEWTTEGYGYAFCPIKCEDVGDCAQWDPGGSVAACDDDGECKWYCDEQHPCPSELECFHHESMDGPLWGECWAPYTF